MKTTLRLEDPRVEPFAAEAADVPGWGAGRADAAVLRHGPVPHAPLPGR